ncbi:MAG: hypothetical protein H7249_13820 [Chitinophagaceae bacterium]|nr:hypothetical protein [Oligoflexus sp.]
MKLELIYDVGCPNIPKAREIIEIAIARLDLDAEWIEWDRASGNSPAYVLQYGSPTILVDGKDIVPQHAPSGNSCRIYRDANGLVIKAPPLESLIRALGTSASNI